MEAQFALLLAAVLLDALLGDPNYPLHPIRLLGHASIALERQCFARGWNHRLAGAVHGLVVTLGALAVWWLVHLSLAALHPALAWLWDLYIAYSLLCTRDSPTACCAPEICWTMGVACWQCWMTCRRRARSCAGW